MKLDNPLLVGWEYADPFRATTTNVIFIAEKGR